METIDWIAIAGLAVVLFGIYRWLQRPTPNKPQPISKQIVVDGTNVMFWKDNTAQVSTLQTVLKRLRHEGRDPVVFLDASSRHHVGDKSLNERKFADVLGVSPNLIMVCPAQTEADAFILEFAVKHNLPVLSNDRFRDRPQEARNVRLVKGHFEGERLHFKNL